MKVFRVLAGALLLCDLVTSAEGSWNSSVPGVHPKRCEEDTRCDCTFTPNGFWDATCQLNGSMESPTPFLLFESLDLSRNSLVEVPTEFLWNQSQLANLSLAHNNITSIEDGAFGTLKKLKSLDLSFNPLQRWEGDLITNLPSLVTLDLTGSLWVPDENVLRCPSLRKIFGVTWSKECFNCTLFKTGYANLPGVHATNPTAKFFTEHGFYVYCALPIQFECMPRVRINRDPREQRKITSVPQKLFYTSYIMGAIAILLNLIILITVLSSKTLRQSTSMLLITNVALCDLLMGIYSVITGSLNIFNFLSTADIRDGKELILGGGVLCPLTTAMFTSAQCVSAVSSLLLTVEKYCSIVHCMNPGRRLGKRVALACLISVWILSLLYALSPLFHVPNLLFSATMMCSFPVSKESNTFLICLGVLIMLYIVDIPLYVGIFFFVRQSGADLGIKREVVILKKIALVVTTNLFLLLTPLILIITMVPVANIHEIIDLNSNTETQILFVFGFWFPIACLGINACINPILCAFRQRQFIKELRKNLRLHSMPLHIQAPFRRGRDEQDHSSSVSTTSSQIVLYKVTHYDN